MAGYNPREEVRGINAPTLNVGTQAVRVQPQQVGVTRDVNTVNRAAEWQSAFNALASGIEHLGNKIIKVDDDKVKEQAIGATIAGQLGDDYDTGGDRRLEKAFAQGQAVRDLRTWSLQQQQDLAGDLASTPPAEVGQIIAQRYAAKRTALKEAGDARALNAFDTYAIELLPQLQNVHGNAYAAHSKWQAV